MDKQSSSTVPSKEDKPKTVGQPLLEFLPHIENYTPTIPDALMEYLLQSKGVNTTDPRIVRLISIASQKFISDIANDALQHCKARGATQNSKSKGKDRQYALTMEDLTQAVAEHGIVVKKPPYFV